ncbi:unnamed protein product [Strongylus vulgaris]|uniref:Uncharacterized protein n=1 Tax=Strongylus vulgaris TaxID=40348 RepID=A0A3P7KH90_STRVU|nr:unnamed protein product [Strongylus vulgaris]
MTGPEIVDYINTHQNYFKVRCSVFPRNGNADGMSNLHAAVVKAKYRPGIEEFVKARIMKEKYLDDPLAKVSKPKEALGDEPIPTR